jgi:3-hydroxyisobutyrate dehydrogenase-like beta-hydroxyacid dehydrogenase
VRVCLLGLGEAGSAIATDLVAAGVEVHGYDPADVATPDGVVRHDDPAAAVGRADVVLALTGAAAARAVLDRVVDALPDDAVYADLSTGSAGLKRELADIVGSRFVDVALMAPVPATGLRTPALASGPAALAFIAAVTPLGMRVESVGDEAGQAATRKLLRSVVMKGLAALLIETLRAAQAAGIQVETWENLVAQLSAIDEALVRRLVTGTGLHAVRRRHEMEATVELLTELGVEPTMSRATAAVIEEIAADPAVVPPLPASEPPTAAEHR